VSLPNPNQLFRQYDAGQITRDEFHAAMRVHAEALIAEMEEAHLNPLAAAFEEMKRRFAEAKLTRRHNEDELRAAFVALSELADFPPALHLWNAAHRHVPLRCFLRPTQEPVFRVLDFQTWTHGARITVEHSAAARRLSTREEIALTRAGGGTFAVSARRTFGINR